MTSRVVIGTPRIPAKPPRRIPCTEPDPPTGEYLIDPGFENWVDTWGTTLIPKEPLWPSADFHKPWRQEFFGPSDEWDVVTTDPDTGTYHIETTIPVSGSSGTKAKWIESNRVMHCLPGGFKFRTAGAVRPGATVTWEVRAKVSSVADGQPQISLPVDFLTATGSGTGAGTSLVFMEDLTTSWATYTCEGAAPPNAAFMRAFIWPGHVVASSTVKTVRIDTCSLMSV